MKQQERIVIVNSIVTCFYWIVLYTMILTRNEGDRNMTDVTITGIIGGCTTIMSAVITLIVARKSQIDKNTTVLEKMSKQLGLNDDISLREELKKQYSSISEDIGRGGYGSLSIQHGEILDEISKSYSEIKNRYDKQDDAYRHFTTEQHDLKQTLDNFSRNYMEVINSEQELYIENCELKKENEKLRNKISQLTKEINHERDNRGLSR